VWSQLHTSWLTISPAKKCNIFHQETLQPTITPLGLYPGNVYPVHEHEKQKPTRTPTPTPTPTLKLLKFVNEIIPFFTSRPSSPRLRMDLTNGNVDMPFGKNAIPVDHKGHGL
jgi:hypothetical protein